MFFFDQYVRCTVDKVGRDGTGYTATTTVVSFRRRKLHQLLNPGNLYWCILMKLSACIVCETQGIILLFCSEWKYPHPPLFSHLPPQPHPPSLSPLHPLFAHIFGNGWRLISGLSVSVRKFPLLTEIHFQWVWACCWFPLEPTNIGFDKSVHIKKKKFPICFFTGGYLPSTVFDRASIQHQSRPSKPTSATAQTSRQSFQLSETFLHVVWGP